MSDVQVSSAELVPFLVASRIERARSHDQFPSACAIETRVRSALTSALGYDGATRRTLLLAIFAGYDIQPLKTFNRVRTVLVTSPIDNHDRSQIRIGAKSAKVLDGIVRTGPEKRGEVATLAPEDLSNHFETKATQYLQAYGYTLESLPFPSPATPITDGRECPPELIAVIDRFSTPARTAATNNGEIINDFVAHAQYWGLVVREGLLVPGQRYLTFAGWALDFDHEQFDPTKPAPQIMRESRYVDNHPTVVAMARQALASAPVGLAE